MPDEVKAKKDVIVDSVSGEEVERTAQPGQTLQPSSGFVSDDSQHVRNMEAHAYEKEAKAVVAEVAKARGITEKEAWDALKAEGSRVIALAEEEIAYHEAK